MGKQATYGKGFRPVALSIAGFDPSAGAGVLADVKTFEQNRVYGLAVNTGITLQNDVRMSAVKWTKRADLEESLHLLSERYNVKAVKLGMHRTLNDVADNVQLVSTLWPKAKIVWDPVMASSSGFDLKWKIDKAKLENILDAISLITPNAVEAENLKLSDFSGCSASWLAKGGHKAGKTSDDELYTNGKLVAVFSQERIRKVSKHGSGCVLSAAITSNLAHGQSLVDSIASAKHYITQFLRSNSTLSGYHNLNSK